MPTNETPAMPTEEQFAAFGKRVAATLGASLEWPGADMLEEIATDAADILQVSVGDQSAAVLAFWRSLADELGVWHDGDFD